jgi:hypothetical protein
MLANLDFLKSPETTSVIPGAVVEPVSPKPTQETPDAKAPEINESHSGTHVLFSPVFVLLIFRTDQRGQRQGGGAPVGGARR